MVARAARVAYLEQSIDVGFLSVFLGHALVFLPGVPFVLAGEICRKFNIVSSRQNT